MKNLFKNKSFYFGLAAIFAVVAGLYMAFPTADDTVQEQTVETTDKDSGDKSVIRAESINSPEVTKPSTPAANTKPVIDSKQNTENEPAADLDADQI